MKHLGTFPFSTWRMPTAALAFAALAGVLLPAQGQLAFPQREAQIAPLTLLLSGPKGDRSALVYSADSGWRMQPGWEVTADADATQPLKVALPVPPEPPADRPALERPLTVFLDGPTGFTFIYLQDEGWKFVGQIANPRR